MGDTVTARDKPEQINLIKNNTLRHERDNTLNDVFGQAVFCVFCKNKDCLSKKQSKCVFAHQRKKNPLGKGGFVNL